MAQEARTGVRRGYAERVAALWAELSATLRRLETLASRPFDELDARATAELARLQYALHVSSERLVGLSPPAAGAAAHAELAEALACARDATAEVAEVAELSGWQAAAPLVYEWRGALFRVRLARMMLVPAQPRPEEPRAAERGDARAALAAFGLTLAGGAAFVSGAVVAAWPLWAAGMLAVVAGLLVYRP